MLIPWLNVSLLVCLWLRNVAFRNVSGMSFFEVSNFPHKPLFIFLIPVFLVYFFKPCLIFTVALFIFIIIIFFFFFFFFFFDKIRMLEQLGVEHVSLPPTELKLQNFPLFDRSLWKGFKMAALPHLLSVSC